MTEVEKQEKVDTLYRRYRPEVVAVDARAKVRAGVKTAGELHQVYECRVQNAQELASKKNADKYGYRLML